VRLPNGKLMQLFMFAFSCLISRPVFAEIPTDYSQQQKPATIKVLIMDKAEGAILEVKGRYHIFDPQTSLPITSSVFGKRAAVYVHGKGIRWGDPFPYINQMRIVPADAECSILINGIEYRGCMEIYNLDGAISIVNEIDIENFLKSTLTVKLPSIQEARVLEALAIVARTNAYYLSSRNATMQWHIGAKEADYSGYGITLQRLSLDRAIEKTKHFVLTYNNQPFAATWTENSAGRTSSYATIFRKQATTPRGVIAPLAAKDRARHHWTITMPKRDFSQLLGLSQISSITPYVDHQSEKTYALRVSDGILTQDIDFFSLQKKLGSNCLLSNCFDIRMKGDQVIFTGFGRGHGVGLCLYSAQQMAQKGSSAAAILYHFFPNTQIQSLSTCSNQ
jgi:stage II sporulation protein D